MIIDFQHHYSSRALHESASARSMPINRQGKTPKYFAPDALFDLDEHIRVMDFAGIDAAMLSSGLGMDGAPMELCRLVNDDLRQAELRFPNRFYGLGHLSPLAGEEALHEVARCHEELGFKGIVITSEVNGLPLDASELNPFWAECERRGMYVFVHPSLRPAAPELLHAYDMLRCVGREFSLVTALIRLIDGGVLDRFPGLKIQMAHLGGGFAVMWKRILAFHNREWLGTAGDPVHGALPERDLEHYIKSRLFFDTAGVFGSMTAIRATISEVPASQVVLGTDYPLEIHTDHAMKELVDNLKSMGADGRCILSESATALLGKI